MGEPRRFELQRGDSGYPDCIAQLSDAPPVLYGRGDPGALRSGVGVVGARRATPYGLQLARMLGGWAAQAGYVIHSGGAVGCDQAAHVAALAVEGRTVAVMGCGADVVYPRSAARLLDEVARSGAVISEHPWGVGPRRWAFRTRNRLIAALSAALIVVEADVGSGTFSTAEYALDLGRDVLSVPGSVFAPECRGTNRLIRNGATPILEVDDLRWALEPLLGPPAFSAALWAVGDDDDVVLGSLRTSPSRPDDLAHSLGLDVVTVVRRLGILEVEGAVSRGRDGRYHWIAPDTSA